MADIAVAEEVRKKAREKKENVHGIAPKISQAKVHASEEKKAQAAQSKVFDHTIAEAPPVKSGNDMRNTQLLVETSPRVEELKDDDDSDDENDDIVDTPFEPSNPLAEAPKKPKRTLTKVHMKKMKKGKEEQKKIAELNKQLMMESSNVPAPEERPRKKKNTKTHSYG